MSIETITGDDTLTLFGRVITDLASGDTSVLDFPNETTKIKTGKNGNTIFAEDQTGKNATLVLKVMRGSDDDVFLLGKKQASDNNYVGTVLASGSFVKHLGDGQGNRKSDVYALSGGMFQKNQPAKENVEGDTEQGISVYTMIFASAQRSIQ